VKCIDVSDDGKQIALAGGNSGGAECFDIVVITADRKLVAYISKLPTDSTLTFNELFESIASATGSGGEQHQPSITCRRIKTGHKGPIYALRFHPNGQFIYTASEDKTVREISLTTDTVTTTFNDHKHSVTGVCVHPRGHLL
jgi:WD40 repeat protein